MIKRSKVDKLYSMPFFCRHRMGSCTKHKADTDLRFRLAVLEQQPSRALDHASRGLVGAQFVGSVHAHPIDHLAAVIGDDVEKIEDDGRLRAMLLDLNLEAGVHVHDRGLQAPTTLGPSSYWSLSCLDRSHRSRRFSLSPTARSRATDEIGFAPLSATQARAIDLAPGHAGFVVTRQSHDLMGRRVEFQVTRADASAIDYIVSIT